MLHCLPRSFVRLGWLAATIGGCASTSKYDADARRPALLPRSETAQAPARPTILAEVAANSVLAFTVDDDGIRWISRADCRLHHASLDGGAATILWEAEKAGGECAQLLSDGRSAFAVMSTAGAGQQLLAWPNGQGPSRVVAGPRSVSIQLLGADGRHVFWVEHVRHGSPHDPGPLDLTVFRAGTDPFSNPEVVLRSVTVRKEGEKSMTVPLGSRVSAVYDAETTMLYVRTRAGELGVVDRDGELTALPLRAPDLLRTDASHVYATYGGTLLRIPKTGGAGVELASGATPITSVLVDDRGVCWATAGGSVGCMRPDGRREVVADDSTLPRELRRHQQYVYWLTPKAIVRARTSTFE